MKFVVEIEVERADGKADVARSRVKEELENDPLSIEDDSFYVVLDSGKEVEYKVKSVTFKEK